LWKKGREGEICERKGGREGEVCERKVGRVRFVDDKVWYSLRSGQVYSVIVND
jgi:hypothetical protein